MAFLAKEPKASCRCAHPYGILSRRMAYEKVRLGAGRSLEKNQTIVASLAIYLRLPRNPALEPLSRSSIALAAATLTFVKVTKPSPLRASTSITRLALTIACSGGAFSAALAYF